MWQVIKSVLAAFFGVQKERQRRRDFEQGRPGHFILVGLVAAAVLVLLVVLLARLAAG
ncbi:DUF2970 domain-containing protein [Halomonas pacifica]|uniref:DUF2970 domain-containing protein n=1 Tax=Bisbaumannia pacifica TaxID=77098 RepID=A0ABD4L596_9GAMM|nr:MULTISPECIES: DUF2970 domain-containing protein [Halomonas]MBH8580626.1 DUF2970 domain-containing protein [Halomonas pacifica]MDC8804736.1 DUF2970 domain-containing protein [Halomonas pacifica]GKW50390.1 hypothetical protein NCCP2165_26050 [Halomonas sp. NCCP-2165]